MDTDKKNTVIGLLKDGRMEAALLLAGQGQFRLEKGDLDPIIGEFADKALKARENGFINDVHRFNGFKRALTAWRDSGPNPCKMILEVDLPAGYAGKILLVLISGGLLDETVCLRSGDLWHREILLNTENELSNLGFHEAKVFPLGGAWARFEPDGSLSIWGTSEDYGSCDQGLVVKLLAKAYPGIKMNIA